MHNRWFTFEVKWRTIRRDVEHACRCLRLWWHNVTMTPTLWACEQVGAALYLLHRCGLWRRPHCSSSIADTTTVGYGRLGSHGWWQFPVVALERQHAIEDAAFDEEARRQAAEITPSNDRLRLIAGTFRAEPGAFADEEMPC